MAMNFLEMLQPLTAPAYVKTEYGLKLRSRMETTKTKNLKVGLSLTTVRVGIFKLSNIYSDSRDLHSAFASIPRVQPQRARLR